MAKPDLNGYEAIFSCLSPLTITINIFPYRNMFHNGVPPQTPLGVFYMVHAYYLKIEIVFTSVTHLALRILHKKLWTCISKRKKKKYASIKLVIEQLTNKLTFLLHLPFLYNELTLKFCNVNLPLLFCFKY